jgi:hypothetical protein
MRGTILAGAVVALGLLSSPSYALTTITLTVTPSELDPDIGQFGSISASSTLPASGTFTGTADFSLTTTGYAGETIGFLVVGTGGLPTVVTLDLYNASDTLIETATESGATSSIALPTKELGGGDYELVLTGTSNTGRHASVGISGGIGTFAVPELSTWGMLTLGFAGLGYAAFRRKAANRMVAAI